MQKQKLHLQKQMRFESLFEDKTLSILCSEDSSLFQTLGTV